MTKIEFLKYIEKGGQEEPELEEKFYKVMRRVMKKHGQFSDYLEMDNISKLNIKGKFTKESVLLN